MSLSWTRASKAHQYGIQQIQWNAEANFSYEFGAYSAFGDRVGMQVEFSEFSCAGFCLGYQVIGINQFVEEAGAFGRFDVEVFGEGRCALECIGAEPMA